MSDPKPWRVTISSRADKDKNRLPTVIQDQLALLVKEMELVGPIRKDWKNFSLLKKKPGVPENAFHCHLKKGRPTYVACWWIVSKNERRIEVYYVGTHENAPY